MMQIIVEYFPQQPLKSSCHRNTHGCDVNIFSTNKKELLLWINIYFFCDQAELFPL